MEISDIWKNDFKKLAVMRGETILTGAPEVCSDCGKNVLDTLGIMSSGGGWYIGTQCDCGPSYSRESQYMPNHETAEKIMTAIKNAMELAKGRGEDPLYSFEEVLKKNNLER